MKYKWLLTGLLLAVLISSCRQSGRKSIEKLVGEWQGKEIVFPAHSAFVVNGSEPVDYPAAGADYKILMYVDTLGCLSCRLQLDRWSEWLAYLDTASAYRISYLFYFYSNDVPELADLLKYKSFRYPVCIDTADSLNRLNRFPSDSRFQTFLLDKNNRVQVIGNPIHNEQVKALYLKRLVPQMQEEKPGSVTEVTVAQPVVDLGEVALTDISSTTFLVKNTGKSPFVITASTVDCGCVSVTYDKAPVKPDANVAVKVTFEPNETGVFEKIVKIYGNMEKSPLTLKIKGRVV